MGRPRTPLAKAKMTGAAKKHPERYRDRKEPDGGPRLGKPPAFFNAAQKKTWAQFKAELPWLVEADRGILTSACMLRRQIDEAGEKATAALYRELRQHLASMGATPVTRSNVSAPGDPDEDDPFAQFAERLN